MTTFDERERGYEAKFAHDEELRFKAISRRDRMLGTWAAAQLGLIDDEAAEYARAVMRAEFSAHGEDDIVQKIDGDFKLKGVTLGEGDIRKKLLEFEAQAVVDIEAGR